MFTNSLLCMFEEILYIYYFIIVDDLLFSLVFLRSFHVNSVFYYLLISLNFRCRRIIKKFGSFMY